MRFIEDQVDIVMSAIKFEKPIIKLVRGYGGDIGIELNHKPIFDSEIISSVDKGVLENVRSSMNVRLNFERKSYYAKVDKDAVVGQVLYTIQQKVIRFLRDKGGFANNRLSKIYKWYNKKLDERSMRSNEKLTQDLYNIVKFTEGSLTDEEQVKTARVLYTLIKDRYEPILGSI